MEDDRFSHISKDPRFRRIPKKDKKVKIDQRFKGMFTEKKFTIKSTVDKRGRKVEETNRENLSRFYEMSDSDDDDDDDDDEDDDDSEEERDLIEESKKLKTTKKDNKGASNKDQGKTATSIKQQIESDKSEEINDEDDEDEDESSEEGDAPDFARGEGNMETSSEEEEDEDETNEAEPSTSKEDDFDHNWAELDKSVKMVDELGKRLAVCNMDWDRIKARDIFVLLNSFIPAGGFIKSVMIYPSEFGIERMHSEQTKGPSELIEKPGSSLLADDDSDDEQEEESLGSRYHREKLRQYQLNRLKYYYAVVECDSIETSNNIYTECDGMEYESSSTKLDLRFIPDDMTFDHDPKDVCTSIPANYKPSQFFTSALAQSKVNLTWDETDQDRIKVTMRPSSKKDEVTEEDFKAYLASDSEGDEDPYNGMLGNNDEDDDDDDDNSDEGEDSRIDKYKKLLLDIQDTEKNKDNRDVEMEVTWEPGLKELTENIIKKKGETEKLTVWDQYLAKKKEKKDKKREERLKKSGKLPNTDVKDAKKKTKKDESEDSEDEDEEEEDGPDGGYQAAFSDDEVDVDREDPFFNQQLLSDDEQQTKQKASSGKKNKKKKKRQENLTPEEKEEMEKQKAELAMLMGEADDDKHFNLKDLIVENKGGKKKKKKLKKKREEEGLKEDDFQIDVKDDRFAAVYSSHLYNIDPSAPEFKKTKAMEKMIDEKINRRTKSDSMKGDKSTKKEKRKLQSDNNETDFSTEPKLKKDNIEQEQESSLASLVKSVKSKTQRFQTKSKLKR